MGAGAESLKTRSRRALSLRFPRLAAALSATPAALPVVEDGAVVDLTFGGGRFYGCDGRDFARRQVAAFTADPARFQAVFPALTDSGALNRSHEAISAECRRLGIDIAALPDIPVAPPDLLIVLGIGLGYHIPELLRAIPARRVIVADTHAEFLLQSLDCVDWAGLLEEADRDGRILDLFVSENVRELHYDVGRTVEEAGGALLDGAAVYLHLEAPPLIELFQRVDTAASLIYVARGGIEDECRQLRNNAANLNRLGFAWIDGARRPRRPEPAALIGSGPSLAADLERIKSIRDRVVLFTGGTALRPCLLAGLVPDYHVELESGQPTYEALRDTVRLGDVSAVTLICSAGVDPRIPGLFGPTHLFFREVTTPSRLFSPPDHVLHQATPLVGNAALRTAAALGFDKLLLFGLDCGSRDPGRDHVAGTIYDTIDLSEATRAAFAMTREVPANFGGTAYSNLTMLMSREILTYAIGALGLRATNCSDGALIDTARPCRAADLRLSGGALDHGAIKAEVAATLPAFAPGGFLRPGTAGRLLAGLRTLCADLTAAFGGEASARGLASAWIAAGAALGLQRQADNPAAPMIAGTLEHWEKMTTFVAKRLPPGAQRQAFESFCLAHMAESLERVEAEVRQAVRDMPDLADDKRRDDGES